MQAGLTPAAATRYHEHSMNHLRSVPKVAACVPSRQGSLLSSTKGLAKRQPSPPHPATQGSSLRTLAAWSPHRQQFLLPHPLRSPASKWGAPRRAWRKLRRLSDLEGPAASAFLPPPSLFVLRSCPHLSLLFLKKD